jgi:phage tail-like protein
MADPYRNYRFLVEIDGIVRAGFQECSGFGSQVEVIEYREGGDLATVRKLPGKATFPDIRLRWGISDDRDLYDWHRTAVNGVIDRRNGSIVLQDTAGEEKLRWNFLRGWPSHYEGPTLNATGNEVAVDSLTITCEGLERA